ncbi:MAG TPA: hypothetical protein VFP92_00470 [Rhodanobacteraceae bacterium]|nr:hypothetical protein [Rhodanobacteraceae bacterium]
MQSFRESKKLHLLSGGCFIAVAVMAATAAIGGDPASTRDWFGVGLFALAATFQFAAYFRARRA